ncbi:MAG: chorismate-binding protein [Pseudonocardia sp.]
MPPTARLHVAPLDTGPGVDSGVELGVGEVVRRLATRERVTAWSGAWSPGALVTCDPVRVADPAADPFAVLADQPVVEPDPAHPQAVGGGWFGYLPFTGPAALAWYADVLRHDGRRWWYEALLSGGFDEAAAAARLAALRAALAGPAAVRPARLELLAEPDPVAHVVAVERCGQAIRRGEIYQANIATQLDMALHGSPHDAWARLVRAHDPARAAFVADPALTAVSVSPELFLRRAGRQVRTAPIKGTRPRTGGGAGSAGDAAERARLRGSAKDAAENVMIVDLMRNDLGRVCTGVRVPGLLDVEPHAGVWHLVSTVTGELAPGHDDADLLAATFPPGSVTGAPKVAAVEVIEELESRPRRLFTGAMGWASPLAGLELNVAIRTLEVAPGGRAVLGVGGGVTVDSTPVEEWAECLTKAAPLLGTLGARVPAPGPGPRLADPGDGIFETLLAVDGRMRRAGEHLRRLRASYLECYGVTLTADVAAAVAAAVPGRGVARVRVDARPGEPDRVRVAVTPADPPLPLDAQPGLALRRHRLGPGGAERHKFADRRWLDAVEAGLDPGEAALLVDDRDVVLESTRACVFVVRGGVPATPPLDGRVLPGTGRRAVLDALDAQGAPYELAAPRFAELAVADGVFLVNAVRGVQWVRSVRGVEWRGPDPVTRWVAKLLDHDAG